jgi:tetratricopeptide (TPR) repeat protein
MKKLLLILLTLLLTHAVAAEPKPADEDVDLVSLAALLTSDGFYHRANDTLDQVDTTVEAFDFSYYYTLRGVVAMKLFDYQGAVDYFHKAFEHGQTDRSVYLYIAEASYKMQDYAGTIAALDDAGELAEKKPNMIAFRAEAYWKLEDHGKALGTLGRGYTTFPAYHQFIKQKFFYLVQIGLYQEALETAQAFIDKADRGEVTLDAQTYVAFANALRSTAQYAQAAAMLEAGHLRFPADAKVTVLLAHTYIDLNRLLAAATLFENASVYERTYTKEASEIYRRAKAFVQALYLNSQVLDQQEKLKQRLAIFVEFAQYDRTVAMHRGLERVGLLQNEEIRYALAYTYYMQGDFETSESLLQSLTKPDLFSKAIKLRDNMEKCKTNRWECI